VITACKPEHTLSGPAADKPKINLDRRSSVPVIDMTVSSSSSGGGGSLEAHVGVHKRERHVTDAAPTGGANKRARGRSQSVRSGSRATYTDTALEPLYIKPSVMWFVEHSKTQWSNGTSHHELFGLRSSRLLGFRPVW